MSPLSIARGVFAFAFLALNTLVWSGLLVALALVKLVLPLAPVRRRIDPVLNAIARAWVACNGAVFRLTQRTAWDVAGTEALQPRDWYMVISNHQSWVDVFVLQRVLGGRVPLLKFFLKQQLVYVPVIGLAWWALDFPFLRRHGKAALKKHPELRTQDRDAAQAACAKFALVPTCVMSFPEGTRFSAAKQARQRAGFRHLLAPKAGALAMSLNALGAKFRSLVDVTIVYPDGVPTFWQFLCGDCPRIVVRTRQLPIAPELCSGDHGADPAFRRHFHRWLEQLWHEKDAAIAALLPPPAAHAVAAGPRGLPRTEATASGVPR
jgi:1-acyl-sn-glycerol-3-phosphate acyltransferase